MFNLVDRTTPDGFPPPSLLPPKSNQQPTFLTTTRSRKKNSQKNVDVFFVVCFCSCVFFLLFSTYLDAFHAVSHDAQLQCERTCVCIPSSLS